MSIILAFSHFYLYTYVIILLSLILLQYHLCCLPALIIYVLLRLLRICRTKQHDKVVCGFSSVEGMALVNVEGTGMVGIRGVDQRIFGVLEKYDVNVALISQAISEHSVTFATLESQAELAKTVIKEEFRRELKLGHISSVDIRAPVSIIAAVGDGM